MVTRLVIDATAQGLPSAVGYYRVFGAEPSPAGEMSFDKADTVGLADQSLSLVLDEMVRAGSDGTVMVVCHGTDLGLLLRLVGGTSMHLQFAAMGLISSVESAEAEAAKIRAMPQDTPNQVEARLKAWEVLIKRIAPETTLGKFSDSEADAFYEKWVANSASRLGMMGRKSADVLRRFLDKIRAVRRLNLARVEFRACDVGKDPDTMRKLKAFFGCKRLLAPKIETFYTTPIRFRTRRTLAEFMIRNDATRNRGRVPGPIGLSTIDERDLEIIKKHTTRTFTVAKVILAPVHLMGMGMKFVRRFLVTVTVDEVRRWHYDVSGSCAPASDMPNVPDAGDLQTFVSRYLRKGIQPPSDGIPLAGFWTRDPAIPFILPGEAKYLENIAEA